ncbi:MAG: SDR family NAD(P)-dependent oxidoreductase, partial [Paracoccus sp. (in: a-proteobacteria)]
MTANRVALVSGANRGIGAAVAQQLHAAGWVVSLGMRQPQLPDWAAADPARVHLARYDATDAGTAADWCAGVADRFGRIDAVVANAGIMIAQDVIAIADEDMARLLDVNVQGP